MDNWPGSLQQHLNSSNFQVALGDTVVRTDMDVGPAKVRSRFTHGVDQYTTSILLTLSQWTTLRDFFKVTLANGSLPFTFTDPMTSTTEIFRFATPPVARPLGGLVFEITMSWEKLP